MKKGLVFSVMIFGTIKLTMAQSFSLVSNNESSGFNDYSVQQFDVFSFSRNPSTLMNDHGIMVGVFSERKFMLQEFSVSKVVFSAATTKGNVGLMATHGGGLDYKETAVSFYYAKKLSDNFNVGTGFNYLRKNLKIDYPYSGIGTSIGFNFILSPQLQSGISFHNPLRLFITSSSNFILQYKYEFGIGCDATSQFYIHIHGVKQENCPAEISAGFQYKPSNKFMCKVGVRSDSKSIYLGAGFKVKKMMVEIMLLNHPQLGISPVLFMNSKIKESFSWNGKVEK